MEKLLKLNSVKSIFGLGLQLAKTEFKVKVEGSYIGILWYLLNPLLTFGALFLVFSDRVGNNIPKYPLYLMLGIIIFNFFQATVSDCTKAFIKEYRTVIKSINFPTEAIIIGNLFKNLFSHFFEILIFISMMIYFKVSLVGIFYYAVLLAFYCFFVFGVSAILVSLTIYFFDLDNIWNYVVRIIWLATPIFYSIGGQVKLFYLSLFNPIYYFITAARDMVIYGKFPPLWIIMGMIGYSFLFFAVGLLIFEKLKVKFAELM
jgi:ABC-type polysaccharide/polyol phosphate export permease